MNKSGILLVALLLLHAKASNADPPCEPLRLCVQEKIPSLDDGISPAYTIASAVITTCGIETNQCISEMQENAIRNIPERLKADGTLDKVPANFIDEVADGIRSEKSAAEFRETINSDMVVPMVLRHRVAANHKRWPW